MTEKTTGGGDWFGHPKGLTVLAGTEVWERFSFYGMQALLMLYMTKYLLLPEHARAVLGLAQFRAGLSAVFGQMTDLAFAAQTYGLYSGLILATPLIGAWLGDRVLGKTKTVTIGALMMAAGHLTMAFEQLFLLALLLLICGGGCVIGNMAAQVGLLYGPEDTRRTRAFGLYLVALNFGALVAPLAIGTLGEKVGWHWGFGVAGIGMLIGLVTYLSGQKHLPPDRISRAGDHARLTRTQWKTIAALLLLLVPFMLVGSALNQAYGVMFVWADTHVDRHIFGWQMPVTWVGTFDGLMTISGVFIGIAIWKRMAARGREFDDLTKFTIGAVGMAVAFLYIAAVARLSMVPMILWLGFYVIADLSTVWFSSPVQSVVSRRAPASVNATMMAVVKLSGAFGFFLLGWLGRFYEPLGPSAYWLLIATLPATALIGITLSRGWIMRTFAAGEREDAEFVPDSEEPVPVPVA